MSADQTSYELLEAGLNVPLFDWSFLPPEVPLGVTPHDMPYIRFLAESIMTGQDRSELEQALHRLDGKSSEGLRVMYAVHRAAYQPPQAQA